MSRSGGSASRGKATTEASHTARGDQRLPKDVIGLVAAQLADVGALGTLSSLCGASRAIYYVARPHLYRRLYLKQASWTSPDSETPWRLFHQIVQYACEVEPKLVKKAKAKKRRLPPYLHSKALPARKVTFSSITERIALVEEVHIADMPESEVWDALLLLTNASASVVGSLFAKLKTVAIWGTFWDQDQSTDEIAQFSVLLGAMMHPESLCLHWPTLTPWVPTEKQGPLWHVPGMLVDCFLQSGPISSVSQCTVTIHNLKLGGIPSFYALNVPAVNVYFAPTGRIPRLQQVDSLGAGGEPNNHLERVANAQTETFAAEDDLENISAIVNARFKQIDQVMHGWARHKHKPFYRLHRVLSEEESHALLRRSTAAGDLGSDGQVSSDPIQRIRTIWMERFETSYIQKHPHDPPKYTWDPPPWREMKKLVDSKISFSPESDHSRLCEHCKKPLFDMRPPRPPLGCTYEEVT